MESNCSTLLFSASRFTSTRRGAQQNSTDAWKSCDDRSRFNFTSYSSSISLRSTLLLVMRRGLLRTMAWKAVQGPFEETDFMSLGITDSTRQTRDSHWFLIMESPTSMILFFLILARKSSASNLRIDQKEFFFENYCLFFFPFEKNSSTEREASG